MTDDAEPPSEQPQSSDVELTAEEASKYVDFINRKAISPTDGCPVCGSPQNFVVEYAYKVETIKEPFVMGGSAMPLFVTICYNCSFVRLFNRNMADAIIEAELAAEPLLPLPEPAPSGGETNGE